MSSVRPAYLNGISSWQHKFPLVKHTLDVQEHEITEDRDLQHLGAHHTESGDIVLTTLWLEFRIGISPESHHQKTGDEDACDVVGRKRINLTTFLSEHPELWDHRNSLKVESSGPGNVWNLAVVEVWMNEAADNNAADEEVVNGASVQLFLVALLVLAVDGVEEGDSDAQSNDIAKLINPITGTINWKISVVLNS